MKPSIDLRSSQPPLYHLSAQRSQLRDTTSTTEISPMVHVPSQNTDAVRQPVTDQALPSPAVQNAFVMLFFFMAVYNTIYSILFYVSYDSASSASKETIKTGVLTSMILVWTIWSGALFFRCNIIKTTDSWTTFSAVVGLFLMLGLSPLLLTWRE